MGRKRYLVFGRISDGIFFSSAGMALTHFYSFLSTNNAIRDSLFPCSTQLFQSSYLQFIGASLQLRQHFLFS